MAQAAAILILIVLITQVATFLMRKADDDLVGVSSLAAEAATSPRPKEIARVRPVEDAADVSPAAQIGIDLLLTQAMRKGAAFDISTVTLVFDGHDVTEKATVLETMDY